MPPRVMRLTADHVAKVHRTIPDPGYAETGGFRRATDDDYDRDVRDMLTNRPDGSFWLFGYGSLIWRPETAFTESRLGTARGWHRRFCLGWDYRFRGSPETPGLMMALDRGGQCKGMLYALPEAALEAELHKLLRREMSMVPSAFPWRWIDVVTAEGMVRAVTFAMNRRSGRYISGLSDDELAGVLATACGWRGSMAEYLFSTVSKLEELGIHDRNLWRLQELVAARIEAAYPGDR
jgi:cation transport protein ChaC